LATGFSSVFSTFFFSFPSFSFVAFFVVSIRSGFLICSDFSSTGGASASCSAFFFMVFLGLVD